MINRKGKDSDTNIVTGVLQTTFRVYRINRNNLLTRTITRLRAATLLLVVIFSPLPFLPSIQAQTKVDVHCHLFNAQDIPLHGIVEKFLQGNPAGLSLFRSWAARLLSETPGFVGENKELNRQLGAGGLSYSMPIYPSSPYPFLDPILKWLYLLKQNRLTIASELVNTYPDVDLFTPAIFDYDHWLSYINEADKKADTTIAEQIILYEKIVRLFEGKIHPLVAFNPLKEIRYKEIPEHQSLKWAKKAVEERGFIGVKLYPPSGFYPINNAVNDQNNPDSPEIDDALKTLYDWCIAEDVPIMAHCANSNDSRPGYGIRAKPEYWKEVLDFQDASGNYIYRNLRLNLAHFGTDEEVRQANSGSGWALEIAELMNNPDYPNVYADTGYHEVVLNNPLKALNPTPRDNYINSLRFLFDHYPKVEERLMYGSDMHTLMVEYNHANYLNEFENIFNAHWPGKKDDFFGQNALRFFGLDNPGTKNRQRLLAFYIKHNMAVKPNWWIGDWWTPDTVAPSTPTNLSVVAVLPCQINLAWNASTDNVIVTGYKIYRGGVEIDTTRDTNYQDTGLSASTTYSYTVYAYDSAGNVSGQSTPASASTP